MPKQENYRVAVIGHTGRGNYGHGLDTVWKDVAKTTLVAVADADADGLTKATQRLGDSIKGFADYRTLLKEMKPDLVSIAPRWLDQHHAMTLAAIDSGVKGIYLEKPMCRSLTEADAMVTAATRGRLTVPLDARHHQLDRQTFTAGTVPAPERDHGSGSGGLTLTLAVRAAVTEARDDALVREAAEHAVLRAASGVLDIACAAVAAGRGRLLGCLGRRRAGRRLLRRQLEEKTPTMRGWLRLQ